MTADRAISFDRAADYYDRTRALSPAVAARVTDLLRSAIGDRSPALEIGVGTGRIALPMFEVGANLAGIDLAAAMLRKLIEKANGRAPFPLAIADATQLPFVAQSFGAVIACHVLHLIPGWRDAVVEVARVLRPGGVFLIEFGRERSEQTSGVEAQFFAFAAGEQGVIGLRSIPELDEELARFGARGADLEPIVEQRETTMERMIARLESGLFSSTWSLSEVQRHAAAAATRTWAQRTCGDLDAPLRTESIIGWRAYTLPS